MSPNFKYFRNCNLGIVNKVSILTLIKSLENIIGSKTCTWIETYIDWCTKSVSSFQPASKLTYVVSNDIEGQLLRLLSFKNLN